MVLKPGSTNVCADALSCWDELLSKEGILTPVFMLPNTCQITIDTDFA